MYVIESTIGIHTKEHTLFEKNSNRIRYATSQKAHHLTYFYGTIKWILIINKCILTRSIRRSTRTFALQLWHINEHTQTKGAATKEVRKPVIKKNSQNVLILLNKIHNSPALNCSMEFNEWHTVINEKHHHHHHNRFSYSILFHISSYFVLVCFCLKCK